MLLSVCGVRLLVLLFIVACWLIVSIACERSLVVDVDVVVVRRALPPTGVTSG